MPETRPLPKVSAKANSGVLVSVEGDDKKFCQDLASLISTSMQSDLQLDPVETTEDANLFVDVVVKDVYLGLTKRGSMKASNTLASVAVGTSTGAIVGSLAGGREGGLIGAGVGAMLGLGVSAADAGKNNTWVMTCEVSVSHKGEQAAPVEHTVTAVGDDMEKESAAPALKERLAQDIVASISIDRD